MVAAPGITECFKKPGEGRQAIFIVGLNLLAIFFFMIFKYRLYGVIVMMTESGSS